MPTTPTAPADGRTRVPRSVPPSVWALPGGETADADGLVGLGADLAPATLVDAYRRGIFPWPHPGLQLPWFCPDPRGVLTLDTLHVSRSLARTLRRSGWTATVDRATDAVLAACADRGAEGTWITAQMRAAYLQLHRLGWVHSVEVWDGAALVGGIYGVQVGGVFTGESMFHRADDASKVALVELLARFTGAGGVLLDVQLQTPHLASLGVREVPRAHFLAWLAEQRDRTVRMPLAAQEVSRLVGLVRSPQQDS